MNDHDGENQNNGLQSLGIRPEISKEVNAFVREITSCMPQLIELALTGSCVTDDYIPGKSDINSVIVIKETDRSGLDALASMGRRYGKKRWAAPLIMTPEYIERSLDVFPIEFLDIKLIHWVVYGDDLFADLPLDRSFLRLQCERDLKAKLIHLHQGYISCAGREKGIRSLLLEAYPGYFPLFRAMLFLTEHGKTPSIPKARVLDDMEEGFLLSMQALREIKATGLKKGFGFNQGTAKDIFFELYRITHELSLTIDRLSH